MEQYPDQPGRRSVEELATPEEVQELVNLANEFLPYSIEVFSSESYRMTHKGGLIFRESLHVANSIEVSETSLLVIEGDFLLDQEQASIVTLVYGEDPEAPPALEGEANIKDLEKSRELCIELLKSGRLDPVETQITLAAIGRLTGYIEPDYRSKPSLITDYEGTAIGCAAAIRRAVKQRNPDFMHVQTYMHEDDDAFTKLTVNHYHPTNAKRYSDWPTLEIVFADHATGQTYTLRRFIDSDIPVVVSDSYGDLTPHWPNRQEVRQLRTAIVRTLETHDILPPGVKVLEDLSDQPEWRGLVDDIRNTNHALASATPDDLETRQRYEYSIEAGMQQLTEEFEAMYHLSSQKNKPSMLSPELERLSIRRPQMLRNTLLLRTPVVYELDLTYPTGYRRVDIASNQVVLLNYTKLSFEDPTGGQSEKDVYVIGLHSKKPGIITVRAVPLSTSANPIHSFRHVNN